MMPVHHAFGTPPHSYGEVSPSYGDGGVMTHDPSVADYRATSPEDGGGVGVKER
jgi:hypothetical protein